eukprot:4014226-Alexandrium_andersonii.AAC.1
MTAASPSSLVGSSAGEALSVIVPTLRRFGLHLKAGPAKTAVLVRFAGRGAETAREQLLVVEGALIRVEFPPGGVGVPVVQ